MLCFLMIIIFYSYFNISLAPKCQCQKSRVNKANLTIVILCFSPDNTILGAMFTKAVDNFVDNSGVHRRQRATVRLLSQLPCHWAEKFFG
jgi:hypothetical protein